MDYSNTVHNIFNTSLVDETTKVSPDFDRFLGNCKRGVSYHGASKATPVVLGPVSWVRFAKIDRFPYLVFFSVSPRFVSVIAIVHGSSEPGKWRDRE